MAGTKCAGNPIVFVKGAKNEVSKRYLERRDHLLTFLQGSAKKQSALKMNFQMNMLTCPGCGTFATIT